MDRDTLITILLVGGIGLAAYFLLKQRQQTQGTTSQTPSAPYYPPTPGSNVVLLGQTPPLTSKPPLTSIPPSSLAGALSAPPPPPPPSYTFHETVIITPSGAGIVTA